MFGNRYKFDATEDVCVIVRKLLSRYTALAVFVSSHTFVWINHKGCEGKRVTRWRIRRNRKQFRGCRWWFRVHTSGWRLFKDDCVRSYLSLILKKELCRGGRK